MPLPSAKSKHPEQKDQKKQKSLLGWLSKPAVTKVANSSSAVNAPGTSSLASSSPSGRDSIFETPSTKRRTTLGTGPPAVTSATYTKSSDGGRSFNETPPTSDPIDVDISSDEDLPCRNKSVCGTYKYAYTLLVTVVCVTGSHQTEDCH
jgi:DNA mismatch repair protein MSH6